MTAAAGRDRPPAAGEAIGVEFAQVRLGRPQLTAGIPRVAKIFRLAVMTQELLDEVRRAPVGPASRASLRQALNASLTELSSCLPPALTAELHRLARTLPPDVSEAELRVQQALLAGWLEGLHQDLGAALESGRVRRPGPAAVVEQARPVSP